jgi:hypothetical protein
VTDATTTTIEAEAPLKREREEVLRTRQEMTVSPQMGALLPTTFEQVMELGQAMAKAGVAVPPHLRGNPGACIAVIFYAMEWRMSIYGVANKSYSVNDRIAFEAQLIHAVIEMRAPLEERLKSRFEGEGDSLKCFVWAKCKGEKEPLEWESPPLGQIQPRKSPLWKTDPPMQLWYYTSRTWARRHFPEILLGLYSKDEMEDTEDQRAEAARDVTPAKTTLAERLMGTGDDREGFKPDDLADVVANGLARPEQQTKTEPEPTKPRRKRREEVVQTDTGPVPTNPVETTPASDAAAPERADSPAATAEEASFVDLVTDTPAGLKDVTPATTMHHVNFKTGEVAEVTPEKPAQTVPTATAPLAPAPAEQGTTRQISSGEARTEPPAEPPKADDAPKPKPVKAKPEAAPKTPQPKTPEEYFEHLKTWMNRTREPDWVIENYKSKAERDLRGACGVIGEYAAKASEIRDEYLRTIS